MCVITCWTEHVVRVHVRVCACVCMCVSSHVGLSMFSVCVITCWTEYGVRACVCVCDHMLLFKLKVLVAKQ